MNPDDLAMIPIYCGVDGEEKAGLCAGTENCWAINNEASEEDIQATIDFLVWVVTSDEGTTMLAREFGPCPFKDAKESGERLLPGCQQATLPRATTLSPGPSTGRPLLMTGALPSSPL